MALHLLFLLIADLVYLQASATGDRTALIERCAACHGVSGIAVDLGTPHLNGQNEDYLLRQIESLHSGRRSKTTMVSRHVPAETRVDDWTALAHYYAHTGPERPAQQVNQEKAARGEQLFYSRCEACHLDEGRDYSEGKSNSIPKLAGQDLAYLLAQMEMFAAGKRPFAALQDQRFHALEIEHFEDLAHFFASRSAVAAPVATKKRRRH